MSSLTAIATYGRAGAGARVRLFEWIERLVPDAAVHSYVGTAVNSPKTLLSRPVATFRAERVLRSLTVRPAERLFVFRQASPFGHGGLEARPLGSADLGVYDFDDGLPWDGGRRSNPGNLIRSSASKCLQSVRHADRVIAGNDYLAEWSSQYARDVVVIPSCVDPQMYRAKDDYEIGDPPRLVWIGSPSSEIYLGVVEPALLRLHRQTGARLTIIGDASCRLEGPLAAMTDRLQWQERQAEQQLGAFDIGLGPLTDDRFSRGKSAYKLLQYGAAGLPFVASPVGTNDVVTRALGGRLATGTDEWVDQVTDLLRAAPAERRAAGESARDAVVRSYSFDAWSERWLEALGLLERLIEADPYEEHHYLQAAELQARSGNRRRALSTLNRAERTLSDLGVVPSRTFLQVRDALSK